jgi:acyl-CoA dehydrogenase
MDFAFNDEQRALHHAVRDYLGDRFTTAHVRELYEKDTDGVPEGLWRAFGEQGWLAVLVPEEHDGIGLGVLDAAVIARGLGAGLAAGPWLGTVLLGEAVRLAGSPEQQASLLPKVASGELKGAVALLSPGSSPTPAGAPAVADDHVLSGTLALVEYAHVADHLLVATQGGGLYLVDPASAGVLITEHESLDRTTRLTTVVLDGAEGVPLPGASYDVVQRLLDVAAVLTANDLVGIARRSLTDVVEYDKQRIQFGKPVGSFQAIKHHLADLHLGITMAEHAATYAAHALDVAADDASVAVCIAKAKASDLGREMGSALIQYLGGIGYTWEHDAHFFFKRSKRQEYAYGDAAQHRERIARLVLDTA